MSQALQVELRSGSFAGLVALYNLFGQRSCCQFHMENLALAAAMRSVGRGPRAAVLLSAPPAVAAVVGGYAAAAVVVYLQSPLDFGLVAAADT